MDRKRVQKITTNDHEASKRIVFGKSVKYFESSIQEDVSRCKNHLRANRWRHVGGKMCGEIMWFARKLYVDSTEVRILNVDLRHGQHV